MDDVLGLRVIDSTAISPDGEWVAVVVQRPQAVGEVYARHYLFGSAQSDVWLLSRRTGDRRELTAGAKDASGYWLPQWSPTGARLAMVSTRPQGTEPRGGDNVRLYVWDRATGALSRRTNQAVDLLSQIDAPGHTPARFAWLSDSTILVFVLPAGTAPFEFELQTATPTLATGGWAAKARGAEATASVLESGVPALWPPTSGLVVINVVRGTSRVVADVPSYMYGKRFAAVSPDRREVAVLVDVGILAPSTAHLISYEAMRNRQLGIGPLDGSVPMHWTSDSVAGGGTLTGLLGWSPNGGEIALVGRADRWAPNTGTLYTVSATTGVTRVLAPPGFDATSLVWASDGRPVVYARHDTADSRHSGDPAADSVRSQARFDWWRLPDAGPPQNLTASLSTAPTMLIPTLDPNRSVGVAGGALWAVELAGNARPVNLTAGSAVHMRGIAWPRAGAGRPVADLLVVSGDSAMRDTGPLYQARITQNAATLTPFTRPSAGAEILGYASTNQWALFHEDAPTGTFLWASDSTGHVTRLLALNEQLARLTPGRQTVITYRGTDGDTLMAAVLLPPGFHVGQRYPVVVWVYAGEVHRDTTGHLRLLTHFNNANPFNLQVLAARGYVVLFPSMPLAPYGVKSDPYIDLPKGVLTAVDQLIAMGIADSNRVGVMGHSFGGYSTYALITYTHRFRAAVALAGPSDLVSLYGQFDPRERYLPAPHDDHFMEEMAETNQVRMGGPPWADIFHYLRNSPLFYVERVETPVLIAQGDLDYAPMTQGEEFFTALYRQGKRAKFIRYWGEDHLISAPANVRHVWGEIFDWFDTYLGPHTIGGGHASG